MTSTAFQFRVACSGAEGTNRECCVSAGKRAVVHRWQRGQWNVERWPIVPTRIGVPQARHGSPPRP